MGEVVGDAAGGAASGFIAGKVVGAFTGDLAEAGAALLIAGSAASIQVALKRPPMVCQATSIVLLRCDIPIL